MRKPAGWVMFLMSFLASPALFAAASQYDSGDPTADEQYVLEVINRARANPTAEGTRLGIDIKEGLTPADAADVGVKQPFAMNKILLGTARAHSKDMNDNNYFAHNSQDGTSPFDRITKAGYIWSNAGENIAFGSGSPSALSLEDLLMVDPNYPDRGHRTNLLGLNAPSREIGVGFFVGSNGGYITQDFASNNVGPFLVGVVYDDTNGNGFYDPGEGISGVTVTPDSGNFFAITGTAGGYAFPVGTSGTLTLTFSGGALTAPIIKQVTLAGQNVRVSALKSGTETVPGTGTGTGTGTGGGDPGTGGGGGGGTVVSNTKTDTDGDGFPDEVEAAMNTSSNDASSTPFGGSSVLSSTTLDLLKMKAALNFKTPGKDSLTLSGTLPVADGFVVENQQIILDVGGVVRTFTLDAKGKNTPKDTQKSFALSTKKKKGAVVGPTAKWAAKVAKSDLAATLVDEKLVNATVTKTSVTVPVVLFFNQQKFTDDFGLLYTAKAMKSGSTSTPK